MHIKPVERAGSGIIGGAPIRIAVCLFDLVDLAQVELAPGLLKRRPIDEEAKMHPAARGSNAGIIPKRRQRRHSYDESVDEPPRLLEDEAVEVEAEISSEENQSVERIEQDDTFRQVVLRGRLACGGSIVAAPSTSTPLPQPGVAIEARGRHQAITPLASVPLTDEPWPP